MSNHCISETPIARKDDWCLALVTLRALMVAASQSVVEERSRPVRRESARSRVSDGEDCKDADSIGSSGTTATPRTSSLASASVQNGSSDNDSDASSDHVHQWHGIGSRLMNVLRADMMSEDEEEGLETSKGKFAEAAWKSVGSRLATVCRGYANGDKINSNSVGCEDASVGNLILVDLTHGIVGLQLRDWYAVGTRLAVSCHNYARWADGKVDPGVWQLLCKNAFTGCIDGSMASMHREFDAMCRGYTTMCRSLATLDKGFDTPRTKEAHVVEAVAWKKTGSRLAAVCRNITDSGSDELEVAFAAVRA